MSKPLHKNDSNRHSDDNNSHNSVNTTSQKRLQQTQRRQATNTNITSENEIRAKTPTDPFKDARTRMGTIDILFNVKAKILSDLKTHKNHGG